MPSFKKLFGLKKSKKQATDAVQAGGAAPDSTKSGISGGTLPAGGAASKTNERVTGVGAGPDRTTAKQAADEAVRQNKDVTVNTASGPAKGSPVDQPAGVTGVGAGANRQAAKEAADAAVRKGGPVTVDTESGTATGAPTGNHSTAQKASRSTQGVTNDTAGVVHYREAQDGQVIDRKYYTGTETRSQDQALVERFREHNLYEKEYETITRPTGRERLIRTWIETGPSEVRIIGNSDIITEGRREISEAEANGQPAAASTNLPAGQREGAWVNGTPGPVSERKTFAIAGDRAVDKERITQQKQHKEFEKEYEVVTHAKGERATGQETKLLSRDRVAGNEDDKVACAGHPQLN